VNLLNDKIKTYHLHSPLLREPQDLNEGAYDINEHDDKHERRCKAHTPPDTEIICR
jgi:hypothetical protein